MAALHPHENFTYERSESRYAPSPVLVRSRSASSKLSSLAQRFRVLRRGSVNPPPSGGWKVRRMGRGRLDVRAKSWWGSGWFWELNKRRRTSAGRAVGFIHGLSAEWPTDTGLSRIRETLAFRRGYVHSAETQRFRIHPADALPARDGFPTRGAVIDRRLSCSV